MVFQLDDGRTVAHVFADASPDDLAIGVQDDHSRSLHRICGRASLTVTFGNRPYTSDQNPWVDDLRQVSARNLESTAKGQGWIAEESVGRSARCPKRLGRGCTFDRDENDVKILVLGQVRYLLAAEEAP